MTTKKILLITVLINLVFIILGLIIGNPPEQYFSKEGTYITWVSFFQLLILANLSWQIYKIVRASSRDKLVKSPALIWGIITIGFLYLATDEVIRIHENLDNIIHRTLHIIRTPITDRLDDILVLLYGIIGIIIMFIFKNELIRYKKSFKIFIIGFVFFFLMGIADMSANNHDVVKLLTHDKQCRKILFSIFKVLEEGFKLFAEAFFIGAFFKCLSITKSKK